MPVWRLIEEVRYDLLKDTKKGMGISIQNKSILFVLASVIIAGSCRDQGLAVFDLQPTKTITQSAASIVEEKGESQIMTPTPNTNSGAVGGQANADVIYVQARFNGETWTFSVTVSHPDTGWDDYSNGWDVVASDGAVLKLNESDLFTRVLLHPHENEQPFTRSQSGIIIPVGITQVRIRAHDLVDGFGGQEILVYLEKNMGDGFEVIR